MVPTDTKISKKYIEKEELPENYPKFEPLVYSVDAFLPVVQLDQVKHWRPKSKLRPDTEPVPGKVHCQCNQGEEKSAINTCGRVIGGYLVFEGTSATGKVNFFDADIGGNFSGSGAINSPPGKVAFCISNAEAKPKLESDLKSNQKSNRFSKYETYLWFHILLGWLLTSVTITGISGLIKKDKD